MIRNILEYLENDFEKKKEKNAVIDKDRTISFQDLSVKSKCIAKNILSLNGALSKMPIAIFLNKSIECVVADIGIIYSGNAYMNLDIKTPAQRLKNIIESVQPAYIVTNDKYKKILLEVCEDNIILNIDELLCDNAAEIDLQSVRNSMIDTDPLCLINTSGSTGTPKSVVLNHRSFVDFVEWTKDTVEWSDHEIMGSLSPVIFDIFSFELCMMMAKGSTLVVIDSSLAAFPVKILELLQKEKVSYIFWVPTIMVNIANMDLLEEISLDTLKMVWFAGEVFPTKKFNYWKKHLPNTRFVNMYGPIEITLDCTYYPVDREIPDDEPIPIGYPCRNTDILLLDENDNLVDDGEGELCVRGTSLAMGYYNNQEKTAVAFVQNPLHNHYPELIYRTGDIVKYNQCRELVFVGRKDSLIKHMGYRIELSEIEHIIVDTLQLAKNACAVYDYANEMIVCYYESVQEISVANFRKNLMKQMPAYMIPTKYIRVDEMPRNPNGKIDRNMLKNTVCEYLNKISEILPDKNILLGKKK